MSRPWKSELCGSSAAARPRCSELAPRSRRVLDELRCRRHAGAGAARRAERAARAHAEPLPAGAVVRARRAARLLLAARGRQRLAQHAPGRRHHFAATLGRQDLVVQAVALPARRRGWPPRSNPGTCRPGGVRWRGRRAARAVELQLLDDLRHLARQVPDEAIVALLREEGSTLLRIERGVPVGAQLGALRPARAAPGRAAPGGLPGARSSAASRRRCGCCAARPSSASTGAHDPGPRLDAADARRVARGSSGGGGA